MTRLFILLTIILVARAACAQQNGFPFCQLDNTSGLSTNSISCIYKDSKGFMWYGTAAGLNRFDGYNFTVFRHNFNDTSSLQEDYVTGIAEGPGGKLWIKDPKGYNSIYDPITEKFSRDIEGYLRSAGLPEKGLQSIIKVKNEYWFLYPTKGIYRYLPGAKPKQVNLGNGIKLPLDAGEIGEIAQNSKGEVWVIYRNGFLEKVDFAKNTVTYRSDFLCKPSTTPIAYTLYLDSQDDVWLYGHYEKVSNTFLFHPQDGSFKQIISLIPSAAANNYLTTGITEGDKGVIWIGVDHGGVYVVDKKNLSYTWLLNKEGDRKSLAANSITCIYRDDLGIVWVGTFKKGISYYHKDVIKFPLYTHEANNPASLCYNDINRFAEDAAGNIWIATNEQGLIYFNRKTNTFKQLRHNPLNNNSLSNDVIITLFMDHNQKLWIGTYWGGLDCYDGKKFVHYKHNNNIASSIASDGVWSIFEDSDNNLWIGTFDAGLDKFNPATNTFYHYKKGPGSIGDHYICYIKEDRQKNLWLSTSRGIDKLNLITSKFQHYSTAANKLSSENVVGVLPDSRGLIWAATGDGLDVLDTATNTFQSFTTADGLPDNSIFSIVEDDAGKIWVGTLNGISRISVGKENNKVKIYCKNYDETDGLQSKEFNAYSALKTRSGELLFGGAKGFNLFNPLTISNDVNKPTVALTGLEVLNKDLGAGDKIDNHTILTQALSSTNTITLRYNENAFSIRFAALNFINIEKNRYAYMLEGFDNNWIVAHTRSRKAIYTNLDAGTYTFRVRAGNADGVWNEKEAIIKIIILPPFWKTSLAYTIYCLLIAGGLFFAWRIVVQRTRMRYELENERKEAQRMQQLDQMKTKFFTNVSHEFRTPLSLILIPLDKLIKKAAEDSEKQQFQLIQRNARRLLNMVNQLLDLRKLEAQELKLNPAQGDIIKFIREISYSFTDIADKKHIRFCFNSHTTHLFTSFDHDKIERILFNLLSNAFKFTPANGKINVTLETQTIENGTLLEIRVKDTGIGIPVEKHNKIFERFFQNEVPGAIINQGSGIGLSITKEFVRLHGGSITVESEIDKGSCFIVNLPFAELQNIEEEELLPEDDEFNTGTTAESESALPVGNNTDTKKLTILLVEDNDDFRFYLRENLREYFTIIEAANGKEGWQKALARHPDLIVTDVYMPEMDGITLCKKINDDARTKKIPVILLTALNDEAHQLKGLETGAADYIPKPFNFEILLRKIKNILLHEETIKSIYKNQGDVKPLEIKAVSPDVEFMQKTLAIVEKNIDNPEFSVKELSSELFMGRVSVYKKIFSLTGKTPLEYIRSVRLEMAAKLLQKNGFTVAEVAYEVGFNNPKYFSKHFKEVFGVLPSAYAAENKKHQPKAELVEE